MKIACASDTHGRWNKLEYPEADVLVLAGDILGNYGRCRGEPDEVDWQIQELRGLDRFVEQLPYKQVVLVAGNHDWAFEKERLKCEAVLNNITYLQDTSATIDGVKFYGSPWQPWFWDWAFNFIDHNAEPLKARQQARSRWGQIPKDTQVLVTHGPPRDILDVAPQGYNVGCPELMYKVMSLDNIRAHIFGHIHCSHGHTFNGATHFVNAAVCSEKYYATNPIRVVEI